MLVIQKLWDVKENKDLNIFNKLKINLILFLLQNLLVNIFENILREK
jgi:hypothetical protein